MGVHTPFWDGSVIALPSPYFSELIVTPQERNVERSLERVRNPMSALRAKCIECMGGHLAEIDRCTARKCPLYQFRNGDNPFHKLSSVYGGDRCSENEELAV